jgi:hypothetical protein
MTNPGSLIIRLPTVFAGAGQMIDRVAADAVAAANALGQAVFAAHDGGVVVVYPTMTAEHVAEALRIARCTPIPDDCRAAATNAGIAVKDHNGLGDRGA